MFPAATKGSGGQGLGFPDVCHTPATSPPIPVPYPTMSQTKTVKKVIASKPSAPKGGLKKSGGDEAGVMGGVASGMMMGAASITLISSFIAYYTAYVSFKLGLDPDNVVIPLLTACMDIVGSTSLIVCILVGNMIF